MFTVSASFLTNRGGRGQLSLVSESFETWDQVRWWLTSILARQLPVHLIESYDRDQLGRWLVKKIGKISTIALSFPATDRSRVSVVNHSAGTVEYYQMGEIVTSLALFQFMELGGHNMNTIEQLRCIRLPAGLSLFDGFGDVVETEGDEEYDENRIYPQVPSNQPETRPLNMPSEQSFIEKTALEEMAQAALSTPSLERSKSG